MAKDDLAAKKLKDCEEVAKNDADYNIYQGTAGILIYLTELYSVCKLPAFLNTATSLGDKLITKIESDNYADSVNYSFFMGRTGMLYALSLLGYASGRTDFKKYYRHSLLNFETDIRIDNHNCEYLYGLAGVLDGLLNLLELTADETFLIPKINHITRHLLSQAHLHNHGLYWDRTYKSIKPICGLSHGAAGIAFILSRLALVFKVEAFAKLATAAFAYEDAQFNIRDCNWPDLRNGIYTKEDHIRFDKHYKSKKHEIFYEPANTVAWCHGAPGALIARSLHFPKRKSQLKNSLFKISSKHLLRTYKLHKHINANHTICHGSMGILLSLLPLENQAGCKELIDEISGQAIEQWFNSGSFVSGLGKSEFDNSMLNGASGVGYILLLLYNYKLQKNNIFRHETCKKFSTDINCTEVYQILYQQDFPLTIEVLKMLDIEFASQKLSANPISTARRLMQFLHTRLEPTQQRIVKDVLKHELFLLRSFNNIKSLSFLEFFTAKTFKLASKTSDQLNIESPILLMTNPIFRHGISRYRWSSKDMIKETIRSVPGDFFYFFKIGIKTSVDYCSEFCYNILDLFKTPKSLNAALEEFCCSYLEEGITKSELMPLIYEQAKILIKKGAIINSINYVN